MPGRKKKAGPAPLGADKTPTTDDAASALNKVNTTDLLPTKPDAKGSAADTVAGVATHDAPKPEKGGAADAAGSVTTQDAPNPASTASTDASGPAPIKPDHVVPGVAGPGAVAIPAAVAPPPPPVNLTPLVMTDPLAVMSTDAPAAKGVDPLPPSLLKVSAPSVGASPRVRVQVFDLQRKLVLKPHALPTYHVADDLGFNDFVSKSRDPPGYSAPRIFRELWEVTQELVTPGTVPYTHDIIGDGYAMGFVDPASHNRELTVAQHKRAVQELEVEMRETEDLNLDRGVDSPRYIVDKLFARFGGLLSAAETAVYNAAAAGHDPDPAQKRCLSFSYKPLAPAQVPVESRPVMVSPIRLALAAYATRAYKFFFIPEDVMAGELLTCGKMSPYQLSLFRATGHAEGSIMNVNELQMKVFQIVDFTARTHGGGSMRFAAMRSFYDLMQVEDAFQPGVTRVMTQPLRDRSIQVAAQIAGELSARPPGIRDMMRGSTPAAKSLAEFESQLSGEAGAAYARSLVTGVLGARSGHFTVVRSDEGSASVRAYSAYMTLMSFPLGMWQIEDLSYLISTMLAPAYSMSDQAYSVAGGAPLLVPGLTNYVEHLMADYVAAIGAPHAQFGVRQLPQIMKNQGRARSTLWSLGNIRDRFQAILHDVFNNPIDWPNLPRDDRIPPHILVPGQVNVMTPFQVTDALPAWIMGTGVYAADEFMPQAERQVEMLMHFIDTLGNLLGGYGERAEGLRMKVADGMLVRNLCHSMAVVVRMIVKHRADNHLMPMVRHAVVDAIGVAREADGIGIPLTGALSFMFHGVISPDTVEMVGDAGYMPFIRPQPYVVEYNDMLYLFFLRLLFTRYRARAVLNNGPGILTRYEKLLIQSVEDGVDVLFTGRPSDSTDMLQLMSLRPDVYELPHFVFPPQLLRTKMFEPLSSSIYGAGTNHWNDVGDLAVGAESRFGRMYQRIQDPAPRPLNAYDSVEAIQRRIVSAAFTRAAVAEEYISTGTVLSLMPIPPIRVLLSPSEAAFVAMFDDTCAANAAGHLVPYHGSFTAHPDIVGNSVGLQELLSRTHLEYAVDTPLDVRVILGLLVADNQRRGVNVNYVIIDARSTPVMQMVAPSSTSLSVSSDMSEVKVVRKRLMGEMFTFKFENPVIPVLASISPVDVTTGGDGLQAAYFPSFDQHVCFGLRSIFSNSTIVHYPGERPSRPDLYGAPGPARISQLSRRGPVTMSGYECSLVVYVSGRQVERLTLTDEFRTRADYL